MFKGMVKPSCVMICCNLPFNFIELSLTSQLKLSSCPEECMDFHGICKHIDINNNDISSLGMDNITSGNNRYISDLVVVYTLNINGLSSFLDNMNISATQSTIGTTVNKGTFVCKSM